MEVFEGPQLQPPRISLLSSAEIITPTNERWGSGFDLIAEGCSEPGIYAICPPANADPKSFASDGDTFSYLPYVIYATDTCSTYPAGREFFDRAQRKLLANESNVLEEILWTGAFGGNSLTASDTLNPGLAQQSTNVVSSANNSWEALAVLEQELSECSGGRSTIHIRPQALIQLLDHKAIRREGNVYLTPMDNILVPGRGYPGTGPTGQAIGATEWMFGHVGIPQVRRGPVIRLGEPKEDEDGNSTYVKATNDRQVVVERMAHVALVPDCCVLAIDYTSLGNATH